MSRLNVKLWTVALFVSASAGCTWVELKEDAVEVALVPMAKTQACKQIGTTTANSTAKLGLIKRGDVKVATEVLTLAKNSAAEMGGNAIAEMEPLSKGSQTFAVFRCPE